MAFDINVFKGVVDNNNELLATNRFLVEFPTPRSINFSNDSAFGFYCKSVNLPGIGLLTSDNFTYGIGPMERTPYAVAINDSLMQFYIDGKGSVRTVLSAWAKSIINATSINGFGDTSYQIAYKKDYCVDIKITTYDKEGQAILETTLVEAFPNYIGDTALDWNDKNSVMILPVAFTYRDWSERVL